LPLYEYQCVKCGHRYEKIKKFSDPPDKKCPECGGKVEQLLSAPAVQFKGSGWYVTDYARKSGGATPPSGDGKSSDAKTGESKSDESKPAEKPETKSDTSTKPAKREKK